MYILYRKLFKNFRNIGIYESFVTEMVVKCKGRVRRHQFVVDRHFMKSYEHLHEFTHLYIQL